MIYDLQKASLTKRLSAFLFDFIILMVAVTGTMLAVASLSGFDSYLNQFEKRRDEIYIKNTISELEEKYKDSKDYRVNFNDYQFLTDEEKAKLPEEVCKSFDACSKELSSDAELIRLYEILMSLSLTILSLGLLIPFIVFEFAVPIFLKNGQTLGKKIFSIAIMGVDGIRISPFVLFVRAILGKYTIGTMVPLLMILSLVLGGSPIITLSVILLILLLQIILCITSKTNSLIHDYLASTVAVDFQSQMIFDSVEDKNAYILRIHSEGHTTNDI